MEPEKVSFTPGADAGTGSMEKGVPFSVSSENGQLAGNVLGFVKVTVRVVTVS